MKHIRIKKTGADLERSYTIRLQLGFIVALGVLIFLFKVQLPQTAETDFVLVETQEIVKMEEIVQTKHIERPPPPPRPPVPVEVPNDEILEDEILEFDAELDMDDLALNMAPPEPPKVDGEEEEFEHEVFLIVEREPTIVGGQAAIRDVLKYPELAMKAGIEGRVYLQFIIDRRGNVKDPVVLRGIGGGCDEAAIEAVKKLKFTPGMQRGKPVNVRFNMPIIFKLRKEQHI